MTGERIPHPDNPEAGELYDLLILASGPWTEARLAAAHPRVVATRRWIEYVALLKDDATLDIDRLTEELKDQVAEHNAVSKHQQDALFKARLKRATARIAKATEHRAAIRKDLLLDED
ncbi:MAG TPA: hypothetical protein VFK56_01145 [Mycobacterium sp.]|nr:hypothetical protein [Mycobacterium sp.]